MSMDAVWIFLSGVWLLFSSGKCVWIFFWMFTLSPPTYHMVWFPPIGLSLVASLWWLGTGLLQARLVWYCLTWCPYVWKYESEATEGIGCLLVRGRAVGVLFFFGSFGLVSCVILCLSVLMTSSFCWSCSSSWAMVPNMVANVVLSAAVAVARLARASVVFLKFYVSTSLAWFAPWPVTPCNVCCFICWSCWASLKCSLKFTHVFSATGLTFHSLQSWN